MKIIFSVLNSGLGNQGGSHTIIQSANTLVDLGHTVYILDSGKNQYTWDKLKAQHIKLKKGQAPDADVVVATAYGSVKPTMNLPASCGIKFHWIRGWEIWQMSEKTIINKILKAQTIKIVNSICLQDKLKEYGIGSTIIRPGHDFTTIYPINVRQNRKEECTVFGGLFNSGKKRRTKRTEWIMETVKFLKDKYPSRDIRLYMYGSDKGSPDSDSYILEPTYDNKNQLYNLVDIWLAPSELEGSHIPPAEAMITGACALSTESQMSGVQDYITHGETGIISENNIDSFIKNAEYLMINSSYRRMLAEAGQAKVIRGIGDRKKNMYEMIQLFRQYI